MKRETSISRRSLLVGTACAALGALTGCTAPEPTAAEPQPELILRYAENQPEDYPTTKAALAFAEMVAQRTDGRVKVVVYSGGELGAELSVIEQMQFGGIDFARVSLSQLAGLLENLSVLQLPYLYEDAKQMWRGCWTGTSGMGSFPRWKMWIWWGFRGSMPVSAAFTPGKRPRHWPICRARSSGCRNRT